MNCVNKQASTLRRPAVYLMKPCFLFWKNAAKQMTPAPPATVAMTDAAMMPLLNGMPSNCVGARGSRARARADAWSFYPT